MNTTEPPVGPDPVLDRLAALAPTDAPDLTDRVFDEWLATDSLIGPVWVASTRDGVSFLRATTELPDDGSVARTEFQQAYRRRFGRPLRAAGTVPAELEAALRGDPTAAPRLDLHGLTDFQRDVLAATRTIPAGETRPYAWVAAEVGRPGAVRAAGTVLATNPVPLLIPCHRVVPSGGRGGADAVGRYIFGVPAKLRLLAAEGAAIASLPTDEESAR